MSYDDWEWAVITPVVGLKGIANVLDRHTILTINTRALHMPDPHSTTFVIIPGLGIFDVYHAYVISISGYFCTSCCFRNFSSTNQFYWWIISSLRTTVQSLWVNPDSRTLMVKNTLSRIVEQSLAAGSLTSQQSILGGTLSVFLWLLRYHFFLQYQWMHRTIIAKPPTHFDEVS